MDASLLPQQDVGIVVVGGDDSVHYLFKRYAEQIGLSIRVIKAPVKPDCIQNSETVAVIFSSVESLEGERDLVVELTNLDIPIIVCSSVFEQSRTRELGADYCLLHPLVFDNFSSVLSAVLKE